MRILVYGAGVLGSYLAHTLIGVPDNEVTVLARGKRAQELKKDGIMIRHYFQRRDTHNPVKVITELAADDYYDLIFVVMQYGQFDAVLPILAANVSENIVLSGNNVKAPAMEEYLVKNSPRPKKVAFGFQTGAGMRTESGKVVAIHGRGNAMFGELRAEKQVFPLIQQAFGKKKVSQQNQIDEWLKAHLAYITPMNGVHYLYDGDLKKLVKAEQGVKEMGTATREAFAVLRDLGYQIVPRAQAKLVESTRLNYLFNQVYHRLPLNRFVKGSPNETAALFQSFRDLKKQSSRQTPTWDKIEADFFQKYQR